MSAEKKIGTHFFNLTPKANGGETIYVTTDFIDNGSNEMYLNQEITLMSYGNCAKLMLYGTPLTPETLRQFADELEQKIEEVKKNL